ncbi:GDSL esterase lipase EXL3-like [Olea europaea subsp. europaea]|nr:GDSL esterase lipase EXL3-like [Olea europaea subsp. europaea]
MRDACLACRRCEEDNYWSGRQPVQFCQILSWPFIEQLVVPKKFAENVREKLAETVTLKVPSGSIWNVGLISDGDTYVLKQGWKKFVEDNFLEEKDILIFKYIGDSIFDVNMFDQKNSCEREATHFAIKCEHSCKRKRKGPGRIEDEDIESSDDDDYHPSNDDDDDDYHSAKSSRGLPTRTNAKAYGAIDKGKCRSSNGVGGNPLRLTFHRTARRVLEIVIHFVVEPLKCTSHRRAVTEEEKEHALEKAKANAASSENCFTVVMRPTHVYRRFFLTIPTKWARVNVHPKNQDFVLRTELDTFKAKYHCRGDGGGLKKGWDNFVVHNFLEEFDVCVFHLASGINDDIVLDVSIFRVVEGVIPPKCTSRDEYIEAHILSKLQSTRKAFAGTMLFSVAATTLAEEVHAKEHVQSKFRPNDVVLYQYEACPFCNKVKAFLDYYDIPYKVVEVNPISKKEIKWSDYKKVPILMVDGDQMVDSSDIIDKLTKKIHPDVQLEDDEEKKWRGWVDNHLVHILSPNIYRSTSEALESFEYITSHAKELGITELIPAYLDPNLKPEDLKKGVSFASGGCGFDPQTPQLVSAISLSDQLELFKEYIGKLKGAVGEEEAHNILTNSIQLVVAGSDDLANTYFTFGAEQLYDINSYSNLMVSSASSFIKELYKLGARRIAVFSIPPIGCLPSQRTVAGGGFRVCAEKYNQAAQLVNSKLSSECDSLAKKLPKSKVVYIDIYNPFLDLIQRPRNYGFEVADRGCCGTGIIEVIILCNKFSGTCPVDTKYVFWDSYHPTERGYKVLLDQVVQKYVNSFF